MKKIAILAALVSIVSFQLPVAYSQAVVADGFHRLQIAYKTATPELQMVGNGDVYALLTLPGFTSGGEVGAPALPIRNDIIEVPFCDNIVVTVENAYYDTIQLPQYIVPYPQQPSRSKSDTSKNYSLVVNHKVYDADALYGLPLVDVEILGVARDRRLAQLHYSPVQVNPVTGQVVVCRSADVTVSYINADVDRTLSHYQRYRTPAFSVGTTLNSLFSGEKAVKQSDNRPVRMVIAVPNVLRCNAIERFANWKRRQGLLVDLLYYQDLGISSNTALASHLTSLYDSATSDNPAPTFLLLVGDHNQLRAFSSRISSSGYYDVGSDHITDLYFVTWTAGDELPDCYQGRFSVTDTATLASVVDKTLLYEQYAFSDDSYLARAVLIAGEDNATHGNYDYAWVYADPTMDYIAYNYVNAANGYDEVFYYKNDTSYAPTGVAITGYCSSSSAATALRNLYNTGLGWINYSAHGDWDKWHKPNFSVNHVNSMSNNGKPSFVIGNCCLTNKFEKSTCFGEALLRKNNAGAVAYIGGTNSTYWEQDFDWSVGVRTNITHSMSPTYSAANMGVYDRLFHTRGQSFDKQVTTAGAMVYYGNLAVNASSPSSYMPNMKKYYWEIYELMGDPSLMPWMGRAADLNVSVVSDGAAINVSTVPHAYVALVDTATLRVLFAGYADEDGRFVIDPAVASDINATLLSVNAQNYKPYFRLFANDPLAIDEQSLNSQLSVFPNPTTDRVTISGLPVGSIVELYNAQGRQVFTPHTSLFTPYSLDVGSLAPGLYLLRIQTPRGVIVRKLIKK